MIVLLLVFNDFRLLFYNLLQFFRYILVKEAFLFSKSTLMYFLTDSQLLSTEIEGDQIYILSTTSV